MRQLRIIGRPGLLILLEHPLSSYVQKVKIALREKGVPFTAEIPQELGSGRAGARSRQRILGSRCPC